MLDTNKPTNFGNTTLVDGSAQRFLIPLCPFYQLILKLCQLESELHNCELNACICSSVGRNPLKIN